MPRIRVLIVDDSVTVRRIISECLAQEPEIEVVGTAPNGQIGLVKVAALNPDLVTLDIEMPVMDGLATLRAIRSLYPRLPVIMCSTLTERGAVATLDALAAGATDYVTKPSQEGSRESAMQTIRQQLTPKIKALCQRGFPGISPRKGPVGPTVEPGLSRSCGIVAVGVSTGGPNALATLLPALSEKLSVPVVIVQHMPPLFTRLLAERLSSVSGLLSHEGAPGKLVHPREVWVAPGGFHMEVESSDVGVRLRTHTGPPENSCRPAVDVLFRSVARTYGARSLAVVLTGMGQDGLRGCEVIRESGGQILVQDEASSVVWGMAGAVSRAGLANAALPLPEMAAEICRRLPKGSSSAEISRRAGGTVNPLPAST